MDAGSLAILNRILVREKHSLLQYVYDAYPWVGNAEQQQTLDRLRQITAEEQESIRQLIRFLARHHVSPGIGRFPEEFTTIHYIGLDHLLPRLVRAQRWAIGELERDTGQLTDAEARALAEQVLEVKRRHLVDLEQMAAESGKTVSTLR